MIGNDIIDLSFARKHTRVKEVRYWKKVLQQEEINWLEKQIDPILAFHTLWAAKEATYKLVSKLQAGLKFSPKKLMITNLPSNPNGDNPYLLAQTNCGIFPVYIKTSFQTIEAFAAKDIASLEKVSFQSVLLPGSSHSIQSYHTKLQLKKALSTFLSIDIEKLMIQKVNSIPKLYISQKKAPIEISLSHHGNWGAFGYLEKP